MHRTAKSLLLFTIIYNIAEGVVAIWAGIAAGSISLLTFGADSYLEVAAASVVYWRLAVKQDQEDDDESEFEERIEKFIGWTFLALAAAVVFQTVVALANRSGAEESVPGIVLALVSVTLMPTIALWKLRLASDMNLRSLAAEAKETLACSYLSVTLLIGLAFNALLGWWWLDPLTALLLVPWLIKEGLEGVRGEDDDEEDDTAQLCSCRKCLFGLRKRRSNCRLA
jgi:divalent metal cation (Fe/Co/Zn/Cd) transporter